jgi:hypothetical protein
MDAEVGQACVEVFICDLCNARVGGPPIGAEDDRGIEVGDQALGNLRARGRVTARQPPNLLPLPLREQQQIWLLPLP